MNIEELLIKEHSKECVVRIRDYIGDDEERFAELMKIFFGDSHRMTQRAAWVLNYCADANPKLVEPYLEKLVLNLRNDVHDAVKRNTVRLLQNYPIPTELEGELADSCFEFLSTHETAVAIKVFSMTILSKIVKKYPELQDELRVLIEDQMPYGTAGFKSRGKKVLAELNKMN